MAINTLKKTLLYILTADANGGQCHVWPELSKYILDDWKSLCMFTNDLREYHSTVNTDLGFRRIFYHVYKYLNMESKIIRIDYIYFSTHTSEISILTKTILCFGCLY